ncbi:MAG: PorP/SprF family type IX secretion system membrane protein, partial [Bacteroidota bacterium]
FNTYYATGSYAYRISFKNDTKLSLGLQAQYDYSRVDWSKLDLLYNIDVGLPIDLNSLSAFNVGAGIYYSGPKFFVGASVPHLLRNSITIDYYDNVGSLNPLRSYYGMGGLVIDVSNNLQLKPSFLVSYVPNAPFEMDLNLSALLMKTIWVGANYRKDESIGGFVQFPVGENLKLAFGVDYAITALNQYTKGSLEVMAEYVFRRKNDGVNNIRFF